MLVACGARTDLGAPISSDASVTCALPEVAACDAGPAPFLTCAPLHFSSGLAESCALVRSPCVPLDLAAFAPVTCPLAGSDPCIETKEAALEVFALNRYGKGHVAASCDSTGLTGLLQELPLVTYLGGSKDARVASVGSYPCDIGTIGTFLGSGLPAKYVGAPAALANDFDVVVLCGSPTSFMDHSEHGVVDVAWAPTFVSFVRDFGKGLLVVADYARNCASPADVFAPLNAITEGAGISFAAVDLGYSSVTIDAECVPDWPQ